MSTARLPQLDAAELATARDAERELAIVWPLLGRHIAFHRRLVDLTASVKAALLLSQTIYWTRHGRDIAAAAGWFSKTSDQWELETGLSIKEQASARTLLRDLGVLDERREGLPAKLHFQLRAERLAELLFHRTGTGEAGARTWTDVTFVAQLLGPSLAYHRVLAGIGGGVHAGLMLSRALHLTRIHSHRSSGAWIRSSVEFWQRELGLTRREQETTRRDLTTAGIWEESLVGMPPRLVARVRLEGLLNILSGPIALSSAPEIPPTADVQSGESGMWQSRRLVLPKPPQQSCRKRRHGSAETAAPIERSTSSETPPRNESTAGAVRAVEPATTALVLPAGLSADEAAAVLLLVEPWPEHAQALLDELDARLRAGSIRTNCVAYLRGMVRRVAEGRFVPEAGLAVGADRRRRREVQALQAQRVDQRRDRPGTCDPAERANGRAVLRQLLDTLRSARTRDDVS